MAEEEKIRVNLGRPVPLFPLTQVVLLPHAVISPLHIFEERYKRMVDDVLESTGQIAMAVYSRREGAAGAGGSIGDETTGRLVPRTAAAAGKGATLSPLAPIRPGVCLGRILDYQRLPNGRFVIALQGVCRARIRYELPRTADCAYRMAMLDPIVPPSDQEEGTLTGLRLRLAELLKQEPLSELREAAAYVEHMKNASIPTSVLLEFLATEFISDPEVKYQLLEGEHVRTRSRLIEHELVSLARLLRQAEPQRKVVWPKGCSWN